MHRMEFENLVVYLHVYNASTKENFTRKIECTHEYIKLTTITQTCTKKYIIRALIDTISPTISTGHTPDITAQNVPKKEDKFYPINRIEKYIYR
jgi:hypothetical protein